MGARLWTMWWAGLLAAATFAHLLRLMTGAEVAVNGTVIPAGISVAIVLIAGPLSLWLVRRGRGVR